MGQIARENQLERFRDEFGDEVLEAVKFIDRPWIKSVKVTVVDKAAMDDYNAM